jgi:hypothetical protein
VLKPHCIQSSRVLVPASTSKSTSRRYGIQVMAYVTNAVTLSSTVRTGGFELGSSALTSSTLKWLHRIQCGFKWPKMKQIHIRSRSTSSILMVAKEHQIDPTSICRISFIMLFIQTFLIWCGLMWCDLSFLVPCQRFWFYKQYNFDIAMNFTPLTQMYYDVH